jgi:hypothetical protein
MEVGIASPMDARRFFDPAVSERMDVTMADTPKIHGDPSHTHGPDCGHTAVEHDGHTDYLEDGHLHHPHGDHVDEHSFTASAANQSSCTPNHDCGGHEKGHVHGPDCGHERVPHDGHVDYLVTDHLHHPHAGHCDDHGRVTLS